MKKTAVCSSEIPIKLCRTTRCYIPEDRVQTSQRHDLLSCKLCTDIWTAFTHTSVFSLIKIVRIGTPVAVGVGFSWHCSFQLCGTFSLLISHTQPGPGSRGLTYNPNKGRFQHVCGKKLGNRRSFGMYEVPFGNCRTSHWTTDCRSCSRYDWEVYHWRRIEASRI
jgi:hypothetical protein